MRATGQNGLCVKKEKKKKRKMVGSWLEVRMDYMVQWATSKMEGEQLLLRRASRCQW